MAEGKRVSAHRRIFACMTVYKKIFVCLVLFSLVTRVGLQAIIVNKAVAGGAEIDRVKQNDPSLRSPSGSVAEFGYWEHVGRVGMGSGIYLGDGLVLTSAHVGCHPFCMGDGSNYKPDYGSWRILDNPDGGKSDLAVFRVEIGGRTSSLAKLGRLPVGRLKAGHDTPLIMIGTGYGQQHKAVSAEVYHVVLGYETQRQRVKKWGINLLDEILKTPVKTAGGYRTHCFVSTFDRSEGEAQAAEGDSGGAMFAYNADLARWEVVGCLIAVSQLGTYVPFGARTYVGNLGHYRAQLPGLPLPAFAILAQALVVKPLP